GGVLTQVDVVPMNLQSLEVRGIDFEADYRIALDEVLAGAVGDFGLRALVTYTDTFDLTDNNRTTSLAGSTEQPVIQGIGGVPHWRHSVRASYFNDPLSLHLTARYIGGGNISNAYTEKDINILEHDGRWYFDLSVQYELLADDERSAQLFFAVENLLDRDPPIVGGGFNTSATVRSLYDQIGRVFTAGVRLKY
ncbi:MAG TPA: TonB-dependent receptor, partial [Terricaulis sp.]|nr:TonB-dependent receptor [Terricaulis sp.]